MTWIVLEYDQPKYFARIPVIILQQKIVLTFLAIEKKVEYEKTTWGPGAIDMGVSDFIIVHI